MAHPISNADGEVALAVTVNGEAMTVEVPADMRLVTFLRDRLGLTGTKYACEVGVCGVCTVLVDGRPVSSCLALALQVDGAEVLTIEGVSAREDMQVLLDAFVTEGGFQCGFCTSGQIVAISSLMMSDEGRELDDEERRHYLAGNLCRCTGYYGIERAARKALS
jgi:aerobic-type carbon monoxide dehydrogenase small subunit (CoxS/CutS family)